MAERVGIPPRAGSSRKGFVDTMSDGERSRSCLFAVTLSGTHFTRGLRSGSGARSNRYWIAKKKTALTIARIACASCVPSAIRNEHKRWTQSRSSHFSPQARLYDAPRERGVEPHSIRIGSSKADSTKQTHTPALRKLRPIVGASVSGKPRPIGSAWFDLGNV